MLRWLLAVIAVESLTEIVVHSELLQKPKTWIMRCGFFRELLSCPWCTSIWIGFGVFAVVMLKVEVVLIPFVVSRLSNYLHLGFGLLKRVRFKGGA
jgi:hypothetical protein